MVTQKKLPSKHGSLNCILINKLKHERKAASNTPCINGCLARLLYKIFNVEQSYTSGQSHVLRAKITPREEERQEIDLVYYFLLNGCKSYTFIEYIILHTKPLQIRDNCPKFRIKPFMLNVLVASHIILALLRSLGRLFPNSYPAIVRI